MLSAKTIIQKFSQGALSMHCMRQNTPSIQRCLAAMSTLQAQLDDKSRALVIDNGLPERLRFPYVWLRDNCQCDKCFHPVSLQRLSLLRHLDVNISPKHTEVTSTGEVKVVWTDDHTSEFDWNWLKERRFSQEGCAERLVRLEKPNHLWDAYLQENIPKVDFKELMTNNRALLDWLVAMEEVGLTLITGAPTDQGVMEQIGERVAFLKTTSYGNSFTVRSKLNPSSVAYTSTTLGLHTDLPQYNYTPGVQMLHCLSQVPTEGGDNVFSDGFNAADILKRNYPTHYKLLTSTQVDFQDVGTDAYKFHMLQRAPIIQLDNSGKPTKVNYNNQVRDSIMNVPLEDVQPLYEALYQMERILTDEKNIVKHKLKEGEIFCFHNYRVLHGRNGYRVLEGGERYLEGAYLDWDEMRSRRRVLEEEISAEK